MRIILLVLCSLLVLPLSKAQQTSSKSKSSDKIYEKSEINSNVSLKNATLINTEDLEFSPVFYQNGIVYVSSRYKSGAVDKNIGETFFELFYSELDRNANPLEPQDFSVNVNSQVHEGPVAFNREGNLIYFTRNNMKKGIRKADSQGVSRLKIYEARKGAFDWEEVQELPFNNDEYSTCHPALSADGRRLYFTSDMPGGYGGFDLYFVERRGGTWSVPINLGPEINTPQNEVFPYIHESGALFFSSNGHSGYGGLDVFMIDISGPTWSQVKNLGMPFNSTLDDLGFILAPSGKYGFLTSDRTGGYGKDDIYRFELPEGLKDIEFDKKVPARIIAYDEQSNQRINDAEVRVFERSSDGFIEGNDFYDVELMPSTGNSQELVMKLVRKDAAHLGKAHMYTNANGESTCMMKTEKTYVVMVNKSGFSQGEILYSTVGETAPQTIRVPLKALSCAQLNGQVSVENFGTPVGQATVRIVNLTTKKEEVLSADSDGQFDFCLPVGHDFSIMAEKEGYTRGINRVTTVGLQPGNSKSVEVTLEMNPIAESILREPLREGTVIVLEHIYYDFNKSAIRSGAARELDALAQLMIKYPSMEIEMIAHTDSRGSEEYNMELSLERAESAKRYLVSLGVSSNRIKAFGYGEAHLRNDCVDNVDCPEDKHQYNRRTEVKVARIDESVRFKYDDGRD